MFSLFLWLLVIVGLYLLLTRNTSINLSGKNKAREILDERYARGEINKDQYEETKRTLGY